MENKKNINTEFTESELAILENIKNYTKLNWHDFILGLAMYIREDIEEASKKDGKHQLFGHHQIGVYQRIINAYQKSWFSKLNKQEKKEE